MTNHLKEENSRLKTELDKLSTRVDDYEHRGRNIGLLMHGVQGSVNENTDTLVLNVINNELGIQLS